MTKTITSFPVRWHSVIFAEYTDCWTMETWNHKNDGCS